MIASLKKSKVDMISTGVPENAILYIVRNGGGYRDLGSLWPTEESCCEFLGTVRPAILSRDGSTTYDCLAVDGRDWKNVENELEEAGTEEEFRSGIEEHNFQYTS